jgi:hypothetical protein
MIVMNGTPDEIEWWHVGVNGIIKPGETVEMEDGRAKHILNKFNAIGLIQLNFGDNPEEKKKSSMALWRSFWERQIENHNRANEEAKVNGNRYSKPPAGLEEKARQFGVELLRPWRIEKKDSKELDELKNENKSLKGSLETMQAQMTKILEMMGRPQILTPAAVSSDAEKALAGLVESNQNKYKRLGESNMKAWVVKNWDDILQMPEINKAEIRTRYEELYKEPCPDMLA